MQLRDRSFTMGKGVDGGKIEWPSKNILGLKEWPSINIWVSESGPRKKRPFSPEGLGFGLVFA